MFYSTLNKDLSVRNDSINISFIHSGLSIGVCHADSNDGDSDHSMHVDHIVGGDDHVGSDRDSAMDVVQNIDEAGPNAADCLGRCWKSHAVDC